MAAYLFEEGQAGPQRISIGCCELHARACTQDCLAAEACVPACTPQIATGKDADLLLLDKDSLELQYVFAKGKLVRTPEWVLGGAFERGPRIHPRPL